LPDAARFGRRETFLKHCTLLTAAILACALYSPALPAEQARQDPGEVASAALEFLKREARGLPGQIAIEIGTVEARLALSACGRLATFFPAGSRAWGQTSVGVRCAAPSAWTLYVPARVSVTGPYLIAARPLSLGQEIAPGDFAVREGELTQLPAGVLTDPVQAVGRRMANSLQAGQPLRRDAVREPPLVTQGQVVALVVSGPGFRIQSEGHALGKAPEGGRVQVRTASGSVVSGMVRAGPVVEIAK
jgi:flagella basal body P-ring formation protein FlgA